MLYTQKAWLLFHAPCMTEPNYISVQLCSYPIYLSLWSLCQHLQNNIQIFLEFWTNTQCNVSKHRENLRFHWPMNCAILKNKDTKLYLSQNECAISSTTWINLPLLLNLRGQFVTKLNDTGKPRHFIGKQFLIQLGKHLQTKIFMVNVNSIVQCKLSHSELN